MPLLKRHAVADLSRLLQEGFHQALLLQDARDSGAQEPVAVQAIAALDSRTGPVLPDELAMHALPGLALDLVAFTVRRGEIAVWLVTVDHDARTTRRGSITTAKPLSKPIEQSALPA